MLNNFIELSATVSIRNDIVGTWQKQEIEKNTELKKKTTKTRLCFWTFNFKSSKVGKYFTFRT